MLSYALKPENASIKNKRSTVVHIVTSLDFGGVEKHMELISEELYEAAMRHVFVAIGSGGQTSQKLTINGATVICLDQVVRIPSFRVIAGLTKILKEYRPLAVHAHGAEANFHGLIAGWLADVPVRIGEEIGMPEHSAKAKLAFRLVYMLAHRVIGVSGVVSEWLVSNKEISRSKLICMNSPARLPRIRTQLDPELKKIFRVSFVGRLEPVKNPLVLIAVARNLLSMGAPLEIYIIGEGSQRPELEREIKKHNLSTTVKLLGFQSDPASFVRRSNIFVQPSFSEGFSLSLVEAMGCGVPVIAPRIGSAPELVETAVSGWLLGGNSAEAFTEGLYQAWKTGAEKLFEMGQHARSAVEGRFEPTRYVTRLEELYATVATERGFAIT
jgi:glycosyltransferase involved in cell wall biosynthesis